MSAARQLAPPTPQNKQAYLIVNKKKEGGEIRAVKGEIQFGVSKDRLSGLASSLSPIWEIRCSFVKQSKVTGQERQLRLDLTGVHTHIHTHTHTQHNRMLCMPVYVNVCVCETPPQ